MYVDECVYESESFYIVYVVYVNECVYERERVSRLCTWCMWTSVCMKVREFVDGVRGVCE